MQIEVVSQERLYIKILEKPMKSPLISVIVPCYNVENFVVKCIKSLLSQTYKNIEIICVNDCSTDQQQKNLMKLVVLTKE